MFPNMARVEIYTQFLCPYCSRSQALLASKHVAAEEIDITMNSARRAEMIERSGGRTSVPQIFINGQHIGGSDDLAALNARGGLDPLLAG